MKKTVIIFCSLLLTLGAIAQDNGSYVTNGKGMWIGGAVGFGSKADHDGDYTFAPSWGMMFKDNMGFGASLNFTGGNNISYVAFSPYFRYYKPVTQNFSFYGDGYIRIGSYDYDTSDDFDGASTFDFGARLGLQYWFSPRWSVAASTNVLQYNSVEGDGEFGLGLDFRSVNFALLFHF